MAKVVKFINWSNEDFTWKWGGESLNVKSHESVWMQDWKAEHFSKHFTDRELLKAGLPTDHHTRGEFLARSVSESGVEVDAKSDDAVETALLNKNNESTPVEPAEEPKKKPGRPKKEEHINPEFTE